MHTQCTSKITFHHPESFCKEQCVWHFYCTAVYNFTPEFVRASCFKFTVRKSKLTSSCNISSMTWLRIPQTANMFLCQNHCSVKANNREVSCNVQNLLHNCFTSFRIKVINLSCITPRHTSSVVSVVNVCYITSGIVYSLKTNSTVCSCVIMIFKINTYPAVQTKIFAIKCI